MSHGSGLEGQQPLPPPSGLLGIIVRMQAGINNGVLVLSMLAAPFIIAK